MVTHTRRLTADEVLRNPPEGRWELVEGEVIMMAPPGFEHGCIATNIASLLRAHVHGHRLGRVCVEGGFVVSRDPDTVLGPDVSFVSAERDDRSETGFFPGPPTLAVEVVSPDDRAQALEGKARRYLDAGTRLVWIVWPQTRSVTVKRPGSGDEILHQDDTITGRDVVPGFRCEVARFFD